MGILANENAIGGGNYLIERSLRFQSASSQYLSRTFTSSTDRQKYTWSAWVKRGTLTALQCLFATGADSNNRFGIWFRANVDELQVYEIASTTVRTTLNTSMLFRDPSAWYHIVVATDTTQATASERIKIYINGSQVTSFSTATYPAQNYNSWVNANAAHFIGKAQTGGTDYFDGYMTEINFIDGQAITPSSFGETDALSGQWVAKKYTGTYGTNGFYLKFNDGTSTTTLGTDSSGNANNWTLTNFTRSAGVSDCWMIDVPSGNGGVSGTQPSSNYCTLNPIYNSGDTRTISAGNLKITGGAVAHNTTELGTILLPSGKWYFEGTVGAVGASNITGIGTTSIFYQANGTFYPSGSGATFTTNDVIGVAIDVDVGTVQFFKNNVSQGTLSFTAGTTVTPAFALGGAATPPVWYANFGQRSFAYTPPSGFKALCTANLPAPTIAKGNQYMDAVAYAGNGVASSGTTQNISLSFDPDLAWVKNRTSASTNHILSNIQAVGKSLASNLTDAEITNSSITLGTGGFNVIENGGSANLGYNLNLSGQNYVAWAWDAGSSTVTNTSGSISSQVRANTTAGFSIVTYTGTGSNATVGHGLGVAPKMVIVKRRDAAGYSWLVGTTSIGWGNYLALNQTIASTAASTVWNNTAPTSTVFSLGTDTFVNASGGTYVAYCFAEIAGFSKFGSYTGNGSTDGVFNYCGFLPRWVLIKQTSVAGNNWQLIDTARETTNPDDTVLFPNTSGAEGTLNATIDVLSNGFKIRTTDGTVNTSGATYIYACFASNPFQNSNAF